MATRGEGPRRSSKRGRPALRHDPIRERWRTRPAVGPRRGVGAGRTTGATPLCELFVQCAELRADGGEADLSEHLGARRYSRGQVGVAERRDQAVKIS